MPDSYRTLVGLIGGPPAAIRITPVEIDTIRAMVDDLAPLLTHTDRDPAAHVLRELDIRLGVHLAMFGDRDGSAFGIPLVPDEHAALRHVYDTTAGRSYGQRNKPVVDLMRQLDQRIGAAQAAYIHNGPGHQPRRLTTATTLRPVVTA